MSQDQSPQQVQDYVPRERFTAILSNKAIQGPLSGPKETWHSMDPVHPAKQAFLQNKFHCVG